VASERSVGRATDGGYGRRERCPVRLCGGHRVIITAMMLEVEYKRCYPFVPLLIMHHLISSFVFLFVFFFCYDFLSFVFFTTPSCVLLPASITVVTFLTIPLGASFLGSHSNNYWIFASFLCLALGMLGTDVFVES
jgi:hypothetical protein